MKKTIIKISFLMFGVLTMFSCSEKIDEAYANPNNFVRVPVESLLPQIVSAMAGNYAGHGTQHDSRYIGAYVQNWHFSLQNSNFDQMGYTNSVGDVAQSTWRSHYYDIGQNNERMIQWAAEEKKWDYVGVGKAISAWSWLTLTDYYGDVILDDAFRTELITFKFDPQEKVYPHVRKLCFEALENLNKTGDSVSPTNLAKGDAFFFNGDTNKWKKFVYGVLARYHNHLSNKSIYNADSVIYYANLAMGSNADNAAVKFEASVQSATNNFFGVFRNNLAGTGTTNPTAIRQGRYIANIENGTNTEFLGAADPRAWYMLRGNSNGTIVGVEANRGQAAILPATDRPENFWGTSQVPTASNIGNNANARFLFRNDSEFPIMTATEMKFLVAEAAFRKGDKATALQAYKDGISLHFDMLTSKYSFGIPAGKEITAANKAAYLTNVTVVPTSAANLTMTKIMMQKYVAMFGYGVLETWVDMRRFHYSDSYDGVPVYRDFVVPSGFDLFPDNGPRLVYRMRPRFNSEYVWNINELTRIGATTNDYHTKEMWFSLP